jgi:hypothetical protein
MVSNAHSMSFIVSHHPFPPWVVVILGLAALSFRRRDL